MLAAAHLDNFLFLFFVAIAILFQLLTRAATKTRRRTGGDLKRRSASTPQTPTAQAEDSDQDRIRKFLEALGQPTTSQPPPPVAQRPTYRRPIVIPSPMKSVLPPLTTRPPESEPDWPSPRQVPTPPQIPAKPERKVYQPKVAETVAFEVHHGPPPITESEVREAFQQTTPSPIPKSTERKIDIGSMLRSSSGLRNAIILREIFGPPRSLQPLDLVGTV